MSRLQQYVPAAAMLGLSSASALTGYIASFTVAALPAIEVAEEANLAARQWQKAYQIGKMTVPPLAITCATCFAFLAYQTSGIAGRYLVSPSVLYASAAVLAPTIVPFTVLVMGPSTLAPLNSKAAGDADCPTDEKTMSLFKEWSKQNAARAALVGISASLSAFAILAQVA